MRPIRDLPVCRRGGVAVMAALAGSLICSLAAITVDVGSLALNARHLQGAADLSALAAARDLNHLEAAARATAQANLGPEVEVAATAGAYSPDRTLAPAARFVAATTGANAARVTLTQTAPLYFGRYLLGRGSVRLSRSATAAVASEPPRAMFSIGSRLARLDGGVANQLLSALAGGSVSLSVLDYRSLAAADVSLLDFSDALATDLNVTAGDYQGLLDQQVNTGRALELLRPIAGPEADSALSRLSRAAVDATFRLGDLIGIEADSPAGLTEALDARVGVLDLATAMLEVGGGNRQATLNLGAQAGLADLSVRVAIGERPNRSPWLTVTDHDAPIVRTAQARLYIRARTSQKLSGLAQVSLPILIELAPSEARLKAITCDPARTVALDVRPGLAKASVGVIDESRLDDFTHPLSPTPATLVSVAGLVTLTGRADVEVADQGFVTTRFTDAEITARTPHTVQARGLANGLIATLLQRLDIDVHVIGLGLGLGGLVQALGGLVTPLGPVLDAAINPVLDTLGLKLGEADVTVLGAVCPGRGSARAALVG